MRRSGVFLVVLLAGAPAGAEDRATFAVGTASARRGELARGALEVPAGSDAALAIPVAVAHGRNPGPVLALVAGRTAPSTRRSSPSRS